MTPTARRWFRIGCVHDIPRQEGRAVTIGDRDVAVFNLGDRFLATAARCPHRGGPLADGILAGPSVVCPLHAWKINLEHGRVERPAGQSPCIDTYPVRILGDVIAVGLPDSDVETGGEAA